MFIGKLKMIVNLILLAINKLFKNVQSFDHAIIIFYSSTSVVTLILTIKKK